MWFCVGQVCVHRKKSGQNHSFSPEERAKTATVFPSSSPKAFGDSFSNRAASSVTHSPAKINGVQGGNSPHVRAAIRPTASSGGRNSTESCSLSGALQVSPHVPPRRSARSDRRGRAVNPGSEGTQFSRSPGSLFSGTTDRRGRIRGRPKGRNRQKRGRSNPPKPEFPFFFRLS